ncbi:Drug/metabolite transporter [Globisporangium polare]
MDTRENKALLPTSTTTGKASTGLQDASQQPHALLGMACVAASAVCFSLMTTFIKYNTYSMTSMEAVFWRSFVAFSMNYGVIAHTRQNLYVPPEERLMLLYRSIAGFSSISFALYAVSQMVLADASVIIFTSPVMTFFFGECLLHEKIDLPSLLSAIVSFAGLICVVRPGFLFGYDHATADVDGSWIAIGSALLGAIGQTFVFITVRKLRDVNVLVIVHYLMLFSIVMSLLWIAVFQREFVIPNTWSLWMSVVGSGVFTGIGQMLLTKGFQLEKAGIASVMRYLDVVCVFIWDAVLLGEHINHWSVVGAIIICSCAVVTAVRKSKAAQE